MTQQEIQAYNQKLVNENDVITIIEYVKKLNDTFYHIDISFIDDFIELVNKEGFIISHEMLFKYNILSKSDSSQVLRLLDNYNFEISIDYSCIEEVLDHSSKNRNVYMLTQDVFKILCMRSLKTKKYSHYYILLEKAVTYYNDYQNLKLQNKIDKLENTLENRVIVPSCKVKLKILLLYILKKSQNFSIMLYADR